MKDLVPVIYFRFEERLRLYIDVELFIQITEHFFGQINAEETEEKSLSQCGWYGFVLLQMSSRIYGMKRFSGFQV